MPRIRGSPPRLTDATIAKATDRMLRRGYLRLLSRRVLEQQRALRRLIDDDGWAAYLRLEETQTARLDGAMLRAAHWAFRFASRRRG
jgi:hypothetical protein